MIVDILNCSICGQDHPATQTVEWVEPVVKAGKVKRTAAKKPKRFFYCPEKGKQVFLEEIPESRVIDLKGAKGEH